MALQAGLMTPNVWECFFIEAGISPDPVKTHATKFVDEKLTIESLQMLDRSMLKELEVILMGESLCIHKQAKKATTQATSVKALAAKPLPNLEMTLQQFRKFQIDWDIFTKMTNMPSSQANIHLYNCADEAVQNAIINNHFNFFTTDPDKLLDMVEVLVTQMSNPIVQRLAYASMSQDEDVPIQNYLVCLRTVAIDCDFTCPSCEHDLSIIHIKDQIIRAIGNDTIQADLLAKAGTLKSLEQNAHHAEAFESALRDQNSMASTSDVASAQLSTNRRQKNMPQPNKGNVCSITYLNHVNSEAKPRRQTCAGCGSYQHGASGT